MKTTLRVSASLLSLLETQKQVQPIFEIILHWTFLIVSFDSRIKLMFKLYLKLVSIKKHEGKLKHTSELPFHGTKTKHMFRVSASIELSMLCMETFHTAPIHVTPTSAYMHT